MGSELHGKRILITRERNQAKAFSKLVLQHGGKPIEAPLLKISCKHEPGHGAILENLPAYQWLFFTSANGVHCFFQISQEHKVPNKQLATCHLAAVGHKTEDALKEYGYAADFIPSTYNADVMAAEFLACFSEVHPVLLVRGNRSRDVLPEQLAKNKIAFDTMEVYETTYNAAIKDKLNGLLKENTIDFITFTSPSTVEALLDLHVDHFDQLKETACACIGTTTEQKARESGFTHTITPDPFTIEGMVEKISDYIARKG